MPIRINLLAEQQAAEEARRKDPIKRAIMISSVAVALMLFWVLTLHLETRGRRSELTELDASFRSVDEKAKKARSIQAEAGDLERRIASLEKYSTNRVLWASVLDALQKITLDDIRVKSITTGQRYTTNASVTFFTTNINVAFTPPPPSWKFWAGPAAATPAYTLASNVFKTFTNSAPFSTNKLPYTTRMSVDLTNLVSKEVRVKTEFILPAIATEDVDIIISGGDYGNPPASLDAFIQQLSKLPFFASRLSKGEDGAKYIEMSSKPEMDLTLPGSPQYKRFVLRLKYEDQIRTND